MAKKLSERLFQLMMNHHIKNSEGILQDFKELEEELIRVKELAPPQEWTGQKLEEIILGE